MTSYLIVSEQRKGAKEKAFTLCREKTISEFDIKILDLADYESKTSSKKSWGIADVKEIQKTIFLKPLKGTWKALIVLDAHLLTLEAQNALLKLLEEPPDGTLFILVAEYEADLLPTIRSRCHLITLDEKIEITSREKKEFASELEELTKSSIQQKLKKAEKLARNKNEALLWLKKALLIEHENLLLRNDIKTGTRLRSLQDTYRIIKKTNVPVRFVLENLFLSGE